MTTEDFALGVALGILLPPAIAILVQWKWKDPTKVAVAVVAVIAVACLASPFTDTVSLSEPGWDWLIWAALIYFVTVSSYGWFWQPSGIAPTIEYATSTDKGKPRGSRLE